MVLQIVLNIREVKQMKKLSFREFGGEYGYVTCYKPYLVYKEYCLLYDLCLLDYFDKGFRDDDDPNHKLDFVRVDGDVCYTINFKSGRTSYYKENIKEIYDGTNPKWNEFRTNTNEFENHLSIIKNYGYKHKSYIVNCWYEVEPYDKEIIDENDEEICISFPIIDYKLKVDTNSPFYWCIGESNWLNIEDFEVNTNVKPISKGEGIENLYNELKKVGVLDEHK